MTKQPPVSSALLGFLVVEKTPNDDGFIAALMVTDSRGYPLEFRATTPVKPSLVQRTLYGRQLEHFIGVELCGKALIQQSQRKPRVVLVPESQLLDIAEEAKTDMVAVWRAGEALKLQGKQEAHTSHGTIEATATSFQPLVYEGRFADPAKQAETLSYLMDCAGRFDLAEAFERMRAALQLLAKEDRRYA